MRCMQNGMTESAILKLDETLNVLKIMDKIRQQWNLVYPCEEGS